MFEIKDIKQERNIKGASLYSKGHVNIFLFEKGHFVKIEGIFFQGLERGGGGQRVNFQTGPCPQREHSGPNYLNKKGSSGPNIVKKMKKKRLVNPFLKKKAGDPSSKKYGL